MKKYEQDKDSRIFNLVYAAYQDRSTLVTSHLSAGTEGDKELAAEIAVEVRDLIRMDENLQLGIFHPNNHDRLIAEYTPPKLFEQV